MPLYFFWGEEDYLIEKEIKALKKKVLGNEFDALNYRVLNNPEFSVFDEALRTMPMFFGEVFYLIRCDKYFLETKTKQKLDDKQIAQLIESLNNIADRVHFVLHCPIVRGEGKKPDSRKKLYKAVAKLTEIKEFPAYKAYEDYKIAPILKKLAQEKDITLSQDVILHLIQTCGASIRDLDTQLEKLKLFAYPQKEITKNMVEEVTNSSEDIFNLPDLLIKKDFTNALFMVAKILDKSHYLEVLAFLQTSVIRLLKIKLYSKTLNSMDISRKVGQHEFVVKKNMEKLKSINFDELLNLKINLTMAEYYLKSGQMEPLCAFRYAFCTEKKDV